MLNDYKSLADEDLDKKIADVEKKINMAYKMGNYQVNKNDLKVLEYENRILFKYVVGKEYSGNPNGSVENIAGIINEKGNICGMMPHPERAFGSFQENTVLKNILDSINS